MITVMDRTFSSKAEAKRYVQGLLNEPGSMEVPGNQQFMQELLLRHPEVERKVRCGVARIFTRTCTVNSRNRQFVIERLDGSTETFSPTACINGRSSKRSDVLAAMREAIKEDIDMVRLMGGTPQDVVHHVTPFIEVAESFIARSSVEELHARLTKKDQRWCFVNETRAEWCRHHNGCALLSVLSEEDHKRVHRGEVPAPVARTVDEWLAPRIIIFRHPIEQFERHHQHDELASVSERDTSNGAGTGPFPFGERAATIQRGAA